MRKLLSLMLLVGLLSCIPTIVAAQNFRDNATLHANRAVTLMSVNRYPEAIGEFQLAIRLNPHSAVAATLFNNLGICFRETGQYPQAVASFQHAFRIQPGFEHYYKNLIETYQQAGTLRVAQQKLREIVAHNDRDAEAWFLLGLILEEVSEYEVAKRSFLRYLKLEPNSQLAEAARRHL